MIEVIDHFILKFERIPGSHWSCGVFTKKKYTLWHGDLDAIKHCALGHCGARGDGSANTHEALQLVDLFAKFSLSVAEVNDGTGIGYKYGKYPKERILNALNQMREATLAGRDRI